MASLRHGWTGWRADSVRVLTRRRARLDLNALVDETPCADSQEAEAPVANVDIQSAEFGQDCLAMRGSSCSGEAMAGVRIGWVTCCRGEQASQRLQHQGHLRSR
jgi:hypothetical protein